LNPCFTPSRDTIRSPVVGPLLREMFWGAVGSFALPNARHWAIGAREAAVLFIQYVIYSDLLGRAPPAATPLRLIRLFSPVLKRDPAAASPGTEGSR